MTKFKVGDLVRLKPGPSRTKGPDAFQRVLANGKAEGKEWILEKPVWWDILHWEVEGWHGYAVTEDELELAVITLENE